MEKANKDNPVVKALLCCTSYLIDCLNRFIKFISKTAYIQIALTGKNFCAAAWNGFVLMGKNVMTFGVVSSIGSIFTYMGVGFIMIANGILMYVMLNYSPWYQNLVSNWIVPVGLAAVIGMIVGSIIMAIFSFGSDTIL